MNAKLNMQHLVDLMAERNGTTKKSEEHFLKEFFALIQEGLQQDSYVKIKGLGTFKLMEVENRSSIDVNTGKPIDIEGHTKVSFTPDSELKELINKPFANFENVILHEESILKDTLIEVPSEEEEKLEEVREELEITEESVPVVEEEKTPTMAAFISETQIETSHQSHSKWLNYAVGILLIVLTILGIVFLVL
ncbi:MAG: HU family DNA-binding protein [Bacteroidaceae bacterium]|nr:HU family DNA-binding protein [Bacteroidaceae bacterium]